MRYGHFFLSVLIGLGLAAFQTHAAFVSEAFRFEHQNETYTALVITPDSLDWRPLPGSRMLGQQMAEIALINSRIFAEDQYRNRYLDLPNDFFKQMYRTDPIDDGKSTTLIIYKGKSFTAETIQATFRISHSLPSEKIFDFKFPRSKIERKPYPLFPAAQALRTTESLKLGQSTPELWSGSLVELKQLVVNEAAQIDFVPIIVFLAEEARETYLNFSSLPQLPVHEVEEYLKNKYVFPEYYVLTCDQRMISYYSRLGFQLVQQSPIRGQNYAMYATRSQFLENTLNRFKARRGFEIYRSGFSTGYAVTRKVIEEFAVQNWGGSTVGLPNSHCERVLGEAIVDKQTAVLYEQGPFSGPDRFYGKRRTFDFLKTGK